MRSPRVLSVMELKRFLIAGTLNTAFSYGIYAFCLWIGLSYPLANFASMVAGVLMAFATQGLFVFRRFEARRFPVFVTAWLVLWAVNVMLIGLLLPAVGGNAYVAGALTLIVMVPLSFVIQKYLVFGGGSGR